MCRHVSSTVRFWAWRIQCLILAKACSIRLRSGEYGGRNQSLAPAALIIWRMAARLMAAEIVHDDDVARFEHWHEQLRDIGTEALAVDRSVEDARCRQPVAAQGTEEGQRAPVPVRGEAAQALAAESPSA